MSLTEQINQGIKKAMLAKDKERLETLRDIKAKILLEATSGQGSVDESKENAIILKMHKQRMDSYQIYLEQGRKDLADAELIEAEIIEEYMPKMLSEEEVKAKVLEVISELNASGPKDMGKVMGVLTKDLTGKADGKLIASIVKTVLNK